MSLDEASPLRRLQLNELDEISNDAYENSKISKAEIKSVHDQNIWRKSFKVGQKVLYNYWLHLFPGKLQNRWSGPFVMRHISSHGVIEIQNLINENVFKVNGQWLKPYILSLRGERLSTVFWISGKILPSKYVVQHVARLGIILTLVGGRGYCPTHSFFSHIVSFCFYFFFCISKNAHL